MMRRTKSHVVWVVLVLNQVACTWLFFTSSAWLILERVVIPAQLGGDGNSTATFSCGPVSYCMTNVSPRNTVVPRIATVSFGEFCATGYGKHFLDIPLSTWILGAVFIFCGGLMWIGILAGAVVSLCYPAMTRALRNGTAFAALLIIIALLIVAVGFKDSAPDSNKVPIDQDICRMCTDAGAFDRGVCGLGWGFSSAVLITAVQIPVVLLGYYVPHSYSGTEMIPSSKVFPT